MKKLGKDDLYRHIDQFLKEKGIEIRDAAPLGRNLQKGCQVFTDAINNAQAALEKARNRMDGGIDKMRDIVHKKTAPRKKAKKATPKSTPKRKKKAATKKTASKAKASATPLKTRSKKTAKKAAAKKSKR